MSLKSPGQVRDITAALPQISESEFRRRYFGISPSYGCDLSEEDLRYTWEYFQQVREFYGRAAEDGRHVLFTASQ